MRLGQHLQNTSSISLAEVLTPEQSAEGLAQLLEQLPHAAASDYLLREPLVEALQHQADRLQGQAAPASPLWQLAGGSPAGTLTACCLAHPLCFDRCRGELVLVQNLPPVARFTRRG